VAVGSEDTQAHKFVKGEVCEVDGKEADLFLVKRIKDDGKTAEVVPNKMPLEPVDVPVSKLKIKESTDEVTQATQKVKEALEKEKETDSASGETMVREKGDVDERVDKVEEELKQVKAQAKANDQGKELWDEGKFNKSWKDSTKKMETGNRCTIKDQKEDWYVVQALGNSKYAAVWNGKEEGHGAKFKWVESDNLKRANGAKDIDMDLMKKLAAAEKDTGGSDKTSLLQVDSVWETGKAKKASQRTAFVADCAGGLFNQPVNAASAPQHRRFRRADAGASRTLIDGVILSSQGRDWSAFFPSVPVS